ncbi:hypothetical protein F0L74_25805 [Chitinophaga agrisoli]|uniref:Uncharacterized protein n=1 Tax=Chitinophaga agrisoli TaxID=2607653 RepID=A0A5B2VLU0_9BACT|nr:hypothetical protein [Chitinophaga agrisoli]KAA2239610.1 hypothetical protein F0L74_25805 [Chitinophaga agrisoli]
MMKVFYCDYNTNNSIASDEPVQMTLMEALQSFHDITEFEDNFWGLVAPGEGCLQFMNTGEDTWVADIPDKGKNGSHVKKCTFEESLDLVKEVYNQGGLVVPRDWEFEKW